MPVGFPSFETLSLILVTGLLVVSVAAILFGHFRGR